MQIETFAIAKNNKIISNAVLIAFHLSLWVFEMILMARFNRPLGTGTMVLFITDIYSCGIAIMTSNQSLLCNRTGIEYWWQFRCSRTRPPIPIRRFFNETVIEKNYRRCFQSVEKKWQKIICRNLLVASLNCSCEGAL